ncbi:hypothetical protein LTS10_007658 [Elasticomyces elasticus]|nr:hypothetical protein LTS10_007658 [Elasticomyces elasticus]
MRRVTGIHWLAPTVMMASFVCGVLLALSHHIFYANLRGNAVPTEPYRPFKGASLPQQQLNTSVGTAFAFFIRVFLSIAAGTAYTQIFWRSVKGVKQSPTLAELDWASAGLQNVFGLFNLKHGRGYPMLVIMAVIFWCAPIGTIFTPGTLSIESASALTSSRIQVPQYDFASMNFAAPLVGEEGDEKVDWYNYKGPSQPLQHVALAVMGLGSILPITPPSTPNMSWSQDVWGPALVCSDIEGDERDGMWVNIWNAYNKSSETSTVYRSWVPWSLYHAQSAYGLLNASETAMEPFLNRPYIFNNRTHEVEESFQSGPPPGDVALYGDSTSWIAVLPNMQNVGFSWTYPTKQKEFYWNNGPICKYAMIADLESPYTGKCDDLNVTFVPAEAFQDATLLRCDLLNTSYSIKFNYTNGVQDVQVSTDTTRNSPLMKGSDFFLGPKLDGDGTILRESACTTFHQELDNGMEAPCNFSLDSLRLLSYQSISEAFNQFVVGAIGTDRMDGVATYTTIMKTVLAQTTELAFLRGLYTLNEEFRPPLQNLITNNSEGWWEYPGLASSKLPGAGGDLKAALGGLFQNLTISLLSEPYFLPNYSSVFAPDPLTDVTMERFRNVYAYDSVTLWIAYGLSILFTALAVSAGIIALVQNGASYSNYFSTVLRVSRTAELDVQVAGRDGPGHDPLPAYLHHARLGLGSQAVDARGYELVKGSTDQQSLVRSHDIELPRVARTYDGQ